MDQSNSHPSSARAGERVLQPTTAFDSELRRVEDRTASRKLDRLVNDEDLMLKLQLAGYDPESPEWQELRNALIEYGFAVILAWAKTGQLRVKAAQHGKRGVYGLAKIPEVSRYSDGDAHDIAIDLVALSVEKFRKHTLCSDNPSKRWSPTGGASIKTFFIGRCLMDLPDYFESRKERPSTSFDETHESALRRGHPLDVVDKIAMREQIEDAFSTLSAVDREIFELVAVGHTAAEIAELISMQGTPIKEGTVASKISRGRTKMRAQR